MAVSADDVIRELGLQPHPEGGHFRETFRDTRAAGDRACSTAIYYLLGAGERSHWHRVDADELWFHHAGAPLLLSVAPDATDDATSTPVEHVLGTDLAAGQHPHVRVPAHAWQAATSTGDWTLVSCVVVPGFEFGGFELAAPGWSPGAD